MSGQNGSLFEDWSYNAGKHGKQLELSKHEAWEDPHVKRFGELLSGESGNVSLYAQRRGCGRNRDVGRLRHRMKAGVVAYSPSDAKEREAVEAFLSTRSEDTFGALASALFTRLVRYFSIRGLDTETAEELAQDVLMIIYRKAEALRNKESFYGWLYKIARNRHLQHVRQRKNEVTLVDLDRPVCHASKPDTMVSEEAEFLTWISTLEAEEQQIMLLRYVEELSYQEIAAALSIPLGTVKWKLFDAKLKLTAVVNQSLGRLA